MQPRPEQHCCSYHIPANIVNPADDAILDKEELATALNYLQKEKVDLRKGDLVLFDAKIGYRNDGVAIFNGTDIIDLYAEVDDYGSLPPEFHVIENGVSINYWSDMGDTDTTRGITHNNIVWFNHLLVQDQCLQNLCYDFVEDGKYAILTSFIYQNKPYRIIFDYTDVLYTRENHIINVDTHEIIQKQYIQKIIDHCRYSLQNRNMIVFETSTHSGSYEESVNDHTLFVNMQ